MWSYILFNMYYKFLFLDSLEVSLAEVCLSQRSNQKGLLEEKEIQ